MNNNTRIYERNSECLAQFRPDLLKSLKKVQLENFGEVFTSPSGHPNLVLTNEKNENIPLHNYENPNKEAAEFLEQVPESSSKVLFLLGLGLGYGALEISLHRKMLRRIIIFEKDIRLFRHAMDLLDITSLIKDPRVRFSFDGINDFSEDLKVINTDLLTEDAQIIQHVPSCIYDRTYYEKLNKDLVDHLNNFLAVKDFKITYGELFFDNKLENLKTVGKHSFLSNSRDCYENQPAIIICEDIVNNITTEEINILKKSNTVLFAGDSSIQFLKDNGINPDYLTSINPQITENPFSNIQSEDKIDLIVPLSIDPQIIKQTAFSNCHWVFIREGVDEFFAKSFGNADFLPLGACADHLNATAAAWMGCSPIILIGANLTTKETDGELFNSDGNSGPVVSTIEQASKKGGLEQIIDKNPLSTFINCSTSGVKISGAEFSPLDQVKELSTPNKLDIEKVKTTLKKQLYASHKIIKNLNDPLVHLSRNIKLFKEDNLLVSQILKESLSLIKQGTVLKDKSLPKTLAQKMSLCSKNQSKLKKAAKFQKVVFDKVAKNISELEHKKTELALLQADPDKINESVIAYYEWVKNSNTVWSEGLSLLRSNLKNLIEHYKTQLREGK